MHLTTVIAKFKVGLTTSYHKAHKSAKLRRCFPLNSVLCGVLSGLAMMKQCSLLLVILTDPIAQVIEIDLN